MKKIYRVFEEETATDNKNNASAENQTSQTQNTTTTTSNSSPELQNLYNQLNVLLKQLNDYETLYQRRQLQFQREHTEKTAMFNNQISAMKKQIADKGGVVSESLTEDKINYCKSKAMFESAQLSKADELCAAITTANDRLETLSYHIDSKSAMSFARKLLVFINDKYWNDGEDHWNELEDYFRSIIVKSNISLSRREINNFLGEFKNVLKENTAYTWIFGNRANSYVKESLSDRFKRNETLIALPEQMPARLHNLFYNIAVEISGDIEDPEDEQNIYDYLRYALDDFWEEFDKMYRNRSESDEYYDDEKLDIVWNTWKDEMMDIIKQVCSE